MASRREILSILVPIPVSATAEDKEEDGHLAKGQMHELSQGCPHRKRVVVPCWMIEDFASGN
jgi:hypothetical protein